MWLRRDTVFRSNVPSTDWVSWWEWNTSRWTKRVQTKSFVWRCHVFVKWYHSQQQIGVCVLHWYTQMFWFHLLFNVIDGKMYKFIKSIYQRSVASARLNNKLTDWFICTTWVKLGDSASPTLFSIFANHLVNEVNGLDLGFDAHWRNISLLLYADDIVCIAKSEEDLQCILNKVRDWCRRWRVLINTEKSIVHPFLIGTDRSLIFNSELVEIMEHVDSFKYLGVTFHTSHDFTTNAELLANFKSAGRALGKIIAKMREIKDF